MNVLVTGATGFIGGYVIDELLSEGHHVIASSSNKEKAEAMPWFSRVQFIAFDFSTLNNITNYFEFFGSPQSLIHLAWEGLPNYKASFHTQVNLPRHKEFLTNLIDNGLEDLTVTGTCLEYGMQEGMLTEDMAVFPANPYAVAKNELRVYLETLSSDKNVFFKWARLFYMFGKGQNPNSLLSQLDRALYNGEAIFNMSGGEQVRDFLPVQEVAKFIVRIALQNKVTGIINCCSGKPVSVNELVQKYLKEKNKSIQLNRGFYPYPDYEPMSFWGDNTKLKTILNND